MFLLKKITVSAILLLITILLCSCGIPAQRQECFCIPEEFECDLFVTKNDVLYAAVLSHSEGKYTLSVKEPKSMAGMEIFYVNGEFTAKYNDSSLTLEDVNTFFFKDVVEFLQDISPDEEAACEEKDGAYIIKHDEWELVFHKE